jgi:hypothetical protein
MFTFPSSPVGAKVQPQPSQRLEDQPPSGQVSTLSPLSRRIGAEQLPSWRASSVQPSSRAHWATRRRSPGCAPKCKPCPWSFHRRFSNLFYLFTLLLSSRRYADTSVLSLAPLKRLAQSAQVVHAKPIPSPRVPSCSRRRLRRGCTWPSWWRSRVRRPR